MNKPYKKTLWPSYKEVLCYLILGATAVCLPIAVGSAIDSYIKTAEKELPAPQSVVSTIEGYTPGFILVKDENTGKQTIINTIHIGIITMVGEEEVDIRTTWRMVRVKVDINDLFETLEDAVKSGY